MIGDILAQEYLEPISFDEFREWQSLLMAAGWQTVFDRQDSTESCSCCGGDMMVEIGSVPAYDKHPGIGWIICLSCWSVIQIRYVIEMFTVADPDPEPPDVEIFLEQYSMLKPDDQVLVFDLVSIIRTGKKASRSSRGCRTIESTG